ncbi:hypothetical protein SLEP1_g19531 [Rubroshorea leprosula]|uniref:Uncharacterized protein n=1 Tax=Rubroshorea leprosula TaxID=152421 RepID=A0AAV5J8M0_9ROSI|nr:hypothetical protein SLEP1_g19531 [Rubroshorea leprosula]
MEPPSSVLEDEEWEFCDDDGFVYRRKKRRLNDPPLPAADKEEANPEEEENRRREWKRRTLLKVVERYKREIGQWEILSNALKAMQEKAQKSQIEQQERREQQEWREEDGAVSVSSLPLEDRDNGASRSLVDELFAQAEAQEAIIQDVSNLCAVAEAMCDEQEEQLKQSYLDLPIWASPHDLMASLCDD